MVEAVALLWTALILAYGVIALAIMIGRWVLPETETCRARGPPGSAIVNWRFGSSGGIIAEGQVEALSGSLIILLPLFGKAACRA